MSEQREPYITLPSFKSPDAVSVTPVVSQPETVTLVTSRRWAWAFSQIQEYLNTCDQVTIRRNPITGRLQIGAIIAFEDKPD